MNRFVVLMILVIVSYTNASSQEFSIDEQYKQALTNAKMAFEAKQYSQAVVFYREAQKIKPESRLPKYKIEDIRTIYIEKEKKEQPNEVAKSRKTPKEKEVNPSIKDELIQDVATRKMNQEADIMEQEMQTMKVEAVYIDEEPVYIDTSMLIIADVEKNQLSNVKVMKAKPTTQVVASNTSQKEVSPLLEKRTLPVVTPNDSIFPEKEKKQEDVKTTKPPTTYQPLIKEKNKLTDEEHKIWIEKEQKRLAVTYPNKKTVEEMDQPGKHITRVVMNINQKVVIYLKVRHSWGATYFFIDEVGQELKSINEQYFNLMTNLETYGN